MARDKLNGQIISNHTFKKQPFRNKDNSGSIGKAAGEIEIIVNVDENWPDPLLEDKRVTYVHPGSPRGLRFGVNVGASLAKGKYLMKTDDHCLFAPGFDKALIENCEDNWIVIPRRYSLDAENWKINETRPVRDYHYLCYPSPDKNHDMGMHGVEWPERGRERSAPKFDIDDTMSFQGSCWFMHKKWFTDFLKRMDENPIYAGWAQEPTEIGNKTWLGGGKVVCNKKTWYAHLHKGKAYGRGYNMDDKGIVQGHNYAADYWMNNRWPGQIHKINWLVEKFWPVPTWPEDRSLWVSPFKNSKYG